MTAREIVAKWIETEWLSHEHAIRDEEEAIVSGLVSDIEQAIAAAVEEDRRERPHEFVGRSDRDCELCGAPDRDTIHCYSREVSRRFVERAVEDEREACAKIIHDVYLAWVEGDYSPGEAFESAKEKIRYGARPNPAE